MESDATHRIPSTLRGSVEFATKRMGLGLVSDPRPDRVVFVRTDQDSFMRQGVPAIFSKPAESAELRHVAWSGEVRSPG